MLLENVLKEYRLTVRLSSKIYNGYSFNVQTDTIVHSYLFHSSNYNFITYWQSWDCSQQKYTDRWTIQEKISGKEI